MHDVVTILWHFWRARRLMATIRSADDLRSWQEKRLEAFRREVLSKSPFYREFAAVSLRGLPVMDKAAMLASFDAINTAGIRYDEAMQLALEAEKSRDFSPEVDGITVGLSSGTSGRRGLFLASRKERLRWAGVLLAKALPRSILRPHRIAFFLRANSNLYSTLNRSRHLRLDFYDLTKKLEDSFDQLSSTRPDVLTAPASVLRRIAEAVEAGRVKIAPIRLFSVAEVLDPEDDEFISKVFGQRVHQIYQCTEGFLGISDDSGRVRLNEEYVHVEKEWIDRESGRFVPIITDFTRSTQPIVRYRLDDVLVEDTEDGSPFTVLKAIEGRCDDVCYFRSRAGDLIPVFAETLRQAIAASNLPYRDYRIVQTSPEHIELQFEPMLASHQMTTARDLMASVAAKVGCLPPAVTFGAFTRLPQDMKLRRIERRFPVDRRFG